MNRYGKQAMEHWRRTDPERYAQIPNPGAFFSNLGDQVETEIQELEFSLAGPDRPNEGYLEKASRLRMARLAAEEQILTELVLIPEPQPDESQPESWEGLELIRDLNAIERSEGESDPLD